MNVTQFPSLFPASRKWLDKTERTLLSSVFEIRSPTASFNQTYISPAFACAASSQLPIGSRHHSLQKFIKEGHREGCVPVVGTPNHTFDDETCTKRLQGVGWLSYQRSDIT